jgi:3'-5' exoribonuclease
MKEYIVLTRTNGTTTKGAPFCKLQIAASSTDKFELAVWDVPETSGPKVGQKVSFYAIRENGNNKSAAGQDMRLLGDVPEDDPLYVLLPHVVKKELWDDCLDKLVAFCSDEKLISIIQGQRDELYEKYKTVPAAANVHHAFKGGLANHTYEMLHLLLGMYPVMPYPIKIERCVLAILFHDWGKIAEYAMTGDGTINTTEHMYLLGHVYISAYRLNNLLKENNVDGKEIERIVHCVLAHHGQLEFGAPVVPCTQEAQIVSFVDNISAKANVLENTASMEYNRAVATHVIKG